MTNLKLRRRPLGRPPRVPRPPLPEPPLWHLRVFGERLAELTSGLNDGADQAEAARRAPLLKRALDRFAADVAEIVGAPSQDCIYEARRGFAVRAAELGVPICRSRDSESEHVRLGSWRSVLATTKRGPQ